MSYPHQHDHRFGQHEKRAGESKAFYVLLLTAVTMVVEIICGLLFGSMALLADGIHMFSHAGALFISVLAYYMARKYAADTRFSFGTGKMNSLAGFASAMLLLILGAATMIESVYRMAFPQEIQFDAAIWVAVGGLVINGISALILQDKHSHSHEHGEGDNDHHHHHDHNLRSAYLHVITDALTSILAIAALVAGKYAGWLWLDAAMGIVGGVLICRWSVLLMREAGKTLLDWQAPEDIRNAVAKAVATTGATVTDLHVWSIGPGIYSAAIILHSDELVTPEQAKAALPRNLGVVHATVEIHGASERGA